jgi:prefoldin subunit 5
MGMTGTMRGYGSTARMRAGAAGHRMKDRMVEKRLDRSSQEAERLRLENQLLREEVEESRTEHHRILDLLEERMQHEDELEDTRGHSHKGRWMLFLLALGGGVYALVRRMREDETTWETGSSATA